MTNSQVQTFSMGPCADPALDSSELRTWPYWSSLVMIVLHPEDRERMNEGSKWEPWSSVDRARTPPPQAEQPQHTVLPKEDMALFGVAPESDRLVTSTCLFCPAVRRLEFIAQHMLEAHPEECQRKLKRRQDGSPDSEELPQTSEAEAETEAEAVAGPSGIVSSSNAADMSEFPEPESGPSNAISRLSNDVAYSSDELDSKGHTNLVSHDTHFDAHSTCAGTSEAVPYTSRKLSRKRRFSLEKNREYDPDEHCGVLTDPNGKPCCYALSACKLHPVMQRRAVLGRRATYDELVTNCRRRVKEPSQHPRLAS